MDNLFKSCKRCKSEKATLQCYECTSEKDLFCESCFNKWHEKHKKITNCQIDEKLKNYTRDTSKICKMHADKKTKYYCTQCKVLVCSNCIMFGEHKFHEPFKLDKDKILFVSQLQEYKNEVENNLVKINSLYETCEKSDIGLVSRFQQIQNHIESQFKSIIKAIQGKEDEISEEILLSKNIYLKTLQILKTNMTSISTLINNLIEPQHIIKLLPEDNSIDSLLLEIFNKLDKNQKTLIELESIQKFINEYSVMSIDNSQFSNFEKSISKSFSLIPIFSEINLKLDRCKIDEYNIDKSEIPKLSLSNHKPNTELVHQSTENSQMQKPEQKEVRGKESHIDIDTNPENHKETEINKVETIPKQNQLPIPEVNQELEIPNWICVFRDPETKMIYAKEHYNKIDELYEFSNTNDLMQITNLRVIKIQVPIDGTYLIAFNRFFYGNISRSNKIGKFEIATGHLIDSLIIPNAVYGNKESFKWGGFNDINIMFDEKTLKAYVLFKESNAETISLCEVILAPSFDLGKKFTLPFISKQMFSLSFVYNNYLYLKKKEQNSKDIYVSLSTMIVYSLNENFLSHKLNAKHIYYLPENDIAFISCHKKLLKRNSIEDKEEFNSTFFK